jgi:hypothetical protein
MHFVLCLHFSFSLFFIPLLSALRVILYYFIRSGKTTKEKLRSVENHEQEHHNFDWLSMEDSLFDL